MNMRVNGLPSQYTGYKVDVNRIRNNIEKQNETDSFCDRAVISEEGKKALEARMAEVEKQRNIDGVRHLLLSVSMDIRVILRKHYPI